VVPRRAIPLALGLISVSNPQVTVVETLSKLSHDHDEEVSQNAILALGIVGAGTNNSRIAQVCWLLPASVLLISSFADAASTCGLLPERAESFVPSTNCTRIPASRKGIAEFIAAIFRWAFDLQGISDLFNPSFRLI
jgi:hypothetical protein